MKHLLLLLFNISLLCSIIIGIFAAYTNANPFSLEYGTSYTMTKILPQGWGFFTKSPREPLFKFYACENNQLEEIKLNNNSLRTFFGMSRYHRRMNMELHRVMSLIPDSLYVKDKDLACDLHLIHDIEDERGLNYHFVKNGIYAISMEDKKPWMYANKNINYDNQFKVARIQFSNKKDE